MTDGSVECAIFSPHHGISDYFNDLGNLEISIEPDRAIQT